MLKLEELIGRNITLSILNSEKGIYEVRLHGVEVGGIWVENPEMERMLGYERRKQPAKVQPQEKPVFFIPYAAIFFLISSSTELDEDSFSG